MDCCAYNARFFHRILEFAAILFCFTGLPYCRQNDSYALTKHYSEQVFSRALNLADNGLLEESRHLADSVYRLFPYVSVADRYRYNSFLYDAYHSFYSSVKNYDSALAYADSNLRILEKNGETGRMAREYAMAYSRKGNVYMEEYLYDEAFYCYSRSRFIAETIHDSSMLAEYNYALGLLLYRQSKIPEAIFRYKESLTEIWNSENNQQKYHQVQGCLNGLGLFYLMDGVQDSAWAYLKKAEAYIEDNKTLYSSESKFPEIALGVVYGNQARVLEAQGKYAEAEAMYKKSIAINSKSGFDNNSAFLVQLKLASFYIGRKRPDSAMALLNAVEKAIPRNYNDDKQLLWNNTRLTLKKTKAEYYSAYGNKSQADVSLVEYLQYKDSIDYKSKKVQGINMNDVFNNVEKEYAFSLLQKENDLKKAYLFAIIVFVIMLAVIGIMILRNLGKTKKTVITLKGLNEGIKEYGLELKRLLAELEANDKQKDRILRIVVHDLRNPVSGIGTISDMLANRYPEDPEYRHLMKLIRTACSDSMELIGEILTVTDTEQHTVLETQLVPIDTLVTESVELMRFNALEKQQTIIVSPLGRAGKVDVDPEKIRRVLNNLISNAIKFSAPGKEINVCVTEKETFFQVAVKDQGIGIAEKDRDKVFDMFTVVRKAGTAGEKSFGLGLSICQQIIGAHGGRIWFESESGKGATFYIELKKEK